MPVENNTSCTSTVFTFKKLFNYLILYFNITFFLLLAQVLLLDQALSKLVLHGHPSSQFSGFCYDLRV